MTSVAAPAPAPAASAPAPAGAPARPAPARRTGAGPAGPAGHALNPWPLTALLALFPLWWVLGLATLIFPIVAVPMAWQLRRRRLHLPPGFGIWLLFLASVVVSIGLLAVDPPGTVTGTLAGRLPGVVFRLVEYLAVTVIAVYAYNLTHAELPQRRLVRLLGVVFVVTVAGGYLGLLFPYFELTSPLELLLPPSVRSDLFVQSLVHPAAAQLQEVFGYETPRPAAPFGFTNTWGNSLSVLLPWFVVGFVLSRTARHRVLAGLLVAVAIVPAVYSLNRGLWIGLAVAAAYVIARSAASGRLLALGAVVAAVALLLVVAVTTPIASVISERLQHGHSNSIRLFTTEQTIEAVRDSPLLGLGTTRLALGSAQSIAVGKSRDCPRCGNPTLGSNGQIWLVLVSQGLIGVALYSGFFLYGVWRFRRDATPIGYAGVLVLVLSLLYMWFYNALVSPLCFYLLAYVLLARNEGRSSAPPVAAATRPRSPRAGVT